MILHVVVVQKWHMDQGDLPGFDHFWEAEETSAERADTAVNFLYDRVLVDAESLGCRSEGLKINLNMAGWKPWTLESSVIFRAINFH